MCLSPQGRPSGFVGMWPSRAFTFIDNHDTGSTLNHWPFPTQYLPLGYAYIITHPGTPTIFYDHYYQVRRCRGMAGSLVRHMGDMALLQPNPKP